MDDYPPTDNFYDPYDAIPFGDAQRWEDEQVARDRDLGEGWEDEYYDRDPGPESAPDHLINQIDRWVTRVFWGIAALALWYFLTHAIVSAVCS